jgi:hypothetical protein
MRGNGTRCCCPLRVRRLWLPAPQSVPTSASRAPAFALSTSTRSRYGSTQRTMTCLSALVRGIS